MKIPTEPTPADLADILGELHKMAGPKSYVTIYAGRGSEYHFPVHIAIKPNRSITDRTTKATSWAGMIEEARVIAREVGTQANAADIEIDSWTTAG